MIAQAGIFAFQPAPRGLGVVRLHARFRTDEVYAVWRRPPT